MSVHKFEAYFKTHLPVFDNNQKADTVIITCADSRVDPGLLFGFKLNEVFVIRHLAAYIPPHQLAEAFLFKETLELALDALPIKQVLLLGHTQCAGHHHLRKKTSNDQHPIFKKIIPEQIFELMQQSVHHLKQYPSIAEAIRQQKITLNCWYYDGPNKKIHSIDSI